MNVNVRARRAASKQLEAKLKIMYWRRTSDQITNNHKEVPKERHFSHFDASRRNLAKLFVVGLELEITFQIWYQTKLSLRSSRGD